jgi:hypothetical protein
MIIKTRAKFLEKLEAEIERDNETFRLLVRLLGFRDQRPLENNELQQFASIVLRDGLVDLDRIEKQIAKDEAILQKLQPPPPPPPAKVQIVNVLKQEPKQKDQFGTYWKFPCQPLGKEPRCKWRNPSNQTTAAFNPRRFNTGVPTGTRNNLLVVDLDVKDDGVAEFANYIQQHGEPQTLKVKTPTKGYHYYFNYSHADADCQKMIKAHLRNSTKFRGKGIDIRSEGGYIVAPPSTRIEGDYEVTNNRKPIDIPPSLVAWLLEGATLGSPRTPKKHSTQNLAKTA